MPQNLSTHFLESQLPNLGFYCHWKSLDLRSIYEALKAGFDEILRNIQVEARVCAPSEKTSSIKTVHLMMWFQGPLGVALVPIEIGYATGYGGKRQ